MGAGTMAKKTLFQLILWTTILLAVANKLTTKEEVEAEALVDSLNDDLNAKTNEGVEASWDYATNITDANLKVKTDISLKHAKYFKELSTRLRRYNFESFKSKEVKRKLQFLTQLGHSILSDDEYEELTNIRAQMVGNYAKVKVCSYKDNTKCDLTLDPDLESIFTQSKDPEELKYYWTQWYDKAGTPVKDMFTRFVELNDKAAKLNNFTSGAEAWLDVYEDKSFETKLASIFEQMRPFYKQLHGYVRHNLRNLYGDTVVSERGPIPIHLLGNMWAQQWQEISGRMLPFPKKQSVEVTQEMKKQRYTAKKMFELGDDFFQSLNMTKLPKSFWEKSIIEKPKDGRDLVCHASAWDFYKTDDVRIKQCTQVSMEDFETVHHELGHIQYYLQYQHQHHIFRDGANPGFHEAVGNVIALSALTPKHLHKIGLLKDYSLDLESRLNTLFRRAMATIVFLPFAYTLDLYRWSIFRGEVKPEDYNCAFWKLREEYSGVEPPVTRTEADFDAAAKYHMSADVEYLRYLVAFIIQFQFFKAACIKAEQYEPGNMALPLDNCDIYGSAEAGNAFKQMLSMGSSKPWPDAMEVFIGERDMNASAILEYFEPLRVWLETYNKENNVYIGWEKSKKCRKTLLKRA